MVQLSELKKCESSLREEEQQLQDISEEMRSMQRLADTYTTKHQRSDISLSMIFSPIEIFHRSSGESSNFILTYDQLLYIC